MADAVRRRPLGQRLEPDWRADALRASNCTRWHRARNSPLSDLRGHKSRPRSESCARPGHRSSAAPFEDAHLTRQWRRPPLTPASLQSIWKPGVENHLAPRSPLIEKQLLGLPGERSADFTKRQGYVGPAPDGIASYSAWKKPGGKGEGVHVIDIEGGWRFTHSDLLLNSGALFASSQYPELECRDHGTAVLGQVGGDADAYGISGISPSARLSGVSPGSLASTRAIAAAAEKLTAGDVQMLEMHRPGPLHGYKMRADHDGDIAVEWWPDDRVEIRIAAARDTIVVEAARNGGQDFDAPLHDVPDPSFPSSWKNPLDGSEDSEAILVSAGAPPGAVRTALPVRDSISRISERASTAKAGGVAS